MRCRLNEYCTKGTIVDCFCMPYSLNSDEDNSCANTNDTCTVSQKDACCSNDNFCKPSDGNAEIGTCTPYNRSPKTYFGDDDECTTKTVCENG